MKFKLILEILY